MTTLSRRSIWLSLPLLSLGDFLRTRSPQFNEWIGGIHSQYHDLPGAGLFLLVFSPITIVIYLIAITITAGCMQLIWALAKTPNAVAKFTSVPISSFFFLITISTFNSVWDSLSWRFYILALGELVFAIGVIFGLAVYVYTLAE